MKRNFSSFSKYIAIFLILALAVLVTLFSYVLRDLEQYTRLMLDRIEQQTGYSVTLDDISISLKKGSGIQIHNLRITDTAENKLLITLPKVHILTEILPLLRKHLVVSRIELQKPYLYIVNRRGEAISKLLTLPAEKDKLNPGQKSFDFSYSLKKIYITDGTFLYNNTRANFISELSGINIALKRNRRSKAYTLSAGADHGLTFDNNTFVINSTVSISSPAIEMFPAPKNAIEGHIEAVLEKLTLTRNSTTTFEFGRSLADTQLYADPNTITCSNLYITLPNKNALRGTLTLTEPTDAPPLVTGTLSSTMLPFAQAANMLNTIVDIKEPLNSIFKAVPSGELALKDFHISADLHSDFINRIHEINGGFTLKNTVIKPCPTIRPLTIAGAVFDFDNDTLRGNGKMKFLAGDNHTLSTEITTLFSKPRLSATLESELPALSCNEFLKEISAAESIPVQFQSGRIRAATYCNYDNSSLLSLSSALDLQDASYSIADTLTKPAGLENMVSLRTLDTTGALPRSISVQLDISDNLTIAAAIDDIDNPALNGTYICKNLDLSTFGFPGLGPSLAVTGRVNGTGLLKFNGETAGKLPFLGTVELDDFTISHTPSAKPLLTTTLAARSYGWYVALNSSDSRFGATSLQATGQFQSLMPPIGKFTARAGLFDIDDFVRNVQVIRRSLPKKPPGSSESVFNKTDIEVQTAIDTANFLDWTAVDCKTRFLYKNGVMVWDEALLHGGGGTINGSVTYDFSDFKNMALILNSTRSNVDFTWGVPGFAEEKTVTGTMDLRGEFISRFQREEQIGRNMTGDFHVTITDGKIQKFTVLSKILGMLDITRIFKLKSQDLLSSGMIYDQITADFTMQNATMTTENFLLKSPSINFSATGSLDITRQEADLTIGAQPLQKIGRIVGRIPIAGNLLTDENNAFTIGYFKVKGPFKDLSVAPLPVTTVTRAVKKIFKTLIDLPLNLITRDTDNKTPESTTPVPQTE